MKPNNTNPRQARRLTLTIVTALTLTGGTALAACSNGSTTPTTIATNGTSGTGNTTPGNTPTAGNQVVLPVTENPITNTATATTLSIDSVLVENNVDANGKAADDHLEVALRNTGTSELAGIEIFYTFTDPSTNITEHYYLKLPSTFTIPAGGQRVAHFDNTGQADHFPVNEFSLYYTDPNALEVTVVVSATGAAVQTTTLQKDAGGPEAAD